MPRREKPIDPSTGPLAAFARDLRALRKQAGNPTYRALSRRAGYSVTTLSVAASGTRLPALDVTLAYVQACGGDPARWRQRWYQLAAQLAAEGRHDLVADEIPEPEEYAELTAQLRRRTWMLRLGIPLVLGLGALLGLLMSTVGSQQPPEAKVAASASARPQIPDPFRTASSQPFVQYPTPTDSGRCADVATDSKAGQQMVAYPQKSRDTDVQRAAPQLPAVPPAHNTLVRMSDDGDLVASEMMNALAANFTDGTITYYADTGYSDGPLPFMSLSLATPKPGLCPELLAYDGLAYFGGDPSHGVGLIHDLVPGPHLRAAHAVLECGNQGAAGSAFNLCAWAGPDGASGTPFFGQFWIGPDVSDKALQNLSAQQAAAFADALFGAVTAS